MPEHAIRALRGVYDGLLATSREGVMAETSVDLAKAMYGDKAKALPQKVVITILELLLIVFSGWLMFGGGEVWVAGVLGFEPAATMPARRLLILTFSLIVLARMSFMMFRLMKRNIPWTESLSVPFAFAIYYVGFALFVLPSRAPLDSFDGLAILIYAFGSYLNTAGELGRDRFKQRPENRGKLYTGGLFAWSMHINFVGDILWVCAFAMVSRNPWAALVPVLLTLFFVFVNVPALDAYLADQYGEDFAAYQKRTKRLIPFVW